jgi:hypothetical protein
LFLYIIAICVHDFENILGILLWWYVLPTGKLSLAQLLIDRLIDIGTLEANISCLGTVRIQVRVNQMSKLGAEALCKVVDWRIILKQILHRWKLEIS